MKYLTAILTTSLLSAAAACGQPMATHSAPQQSATPAPAQTQSQTSNLKPQIQRPPADPSKFAVIISGIGGEEGYQQQFAKWSSDLRGALTDRLGFAEDQVTLLCEKPGDGDLKATAAEVRRVFTALKTATKPEHAVFIFFIGHGSFDSKEAKFNLIGPDIAAAEYAALIKALPARRVVVVNTASASGEFIKPLSGAGRVVVTATRSGMEQNATRFAEHFIAALTSSEADADKNNRISVLEAYDYAARMTAQFYEEQKRLATEHPLIDDNGDGKGHAKAEEGDGRLAQTTYFDSLPMQQAGGDAELQKLIAERTELEAQVEQLKARKEQMKAEEYETELEKLLLKLAELNQKIQAKQKQ
jgi:hypothetical protein